MLHLADRWSLAIYPAPGRNAARLLDRKSEVSLHPSRPLWPLRRPCASPTLKASKVRLSAPREANLTTSQTLVREAEAEFLATHEQDLSAIVAGPDTLERVREKQRECKRPFEPRMRRDDSL